MQNRTPWALACSALLSIACGGAPFTLAPTDGPETASSSPATNTSTSTAIATMPDTEASPPPGADASPPPAPDASSASSSSSAGVDAEALDAGRDVEPLEASADAAEEPPPVCPKPSVQYEIPVNGIIYGTLPTPEECWCTPTCACLETQNLCSSGNATSCTDGDPIVLGCP